MSVCSCMRTGAALHGMPGGIQFHSLRPFAAAAEARGEGGREKRVSSFLRRTRASAVRDEVRGDKRARKGRGECKMRRISANAFEGERKSVWGRGRKGRRKTGDKCPNRHPPPSSSTQFNRLSRARSF